MLLVKFVVNCVLLIVCIYIVCVYAAHDYWTDSQGHCW